MGRDKSVASCSDNLHPIILRLQSKPEKLMGIVGLVLLLAFLLKAAAAPERNQLSLNHVAHVAALSSADVAMDSYMESSTNQARLVGRSREQRTAQVEAEALGEEPKHVDGGTHMELPPSRMLVKKGSLLLRSPRTKAAVEALIEATNAAILKRGGYIENLKRSTRTMRNFHSDDLDDKLPDTADPEVRRDREGEQLTVTMVVRVPVDLFLDLFAALKHLPQALVRDESYGVDDVTSRYVDVAARAASLQATHDQLVQLMNRAEKIQDVLKVQEHLTNVRQDLEAKKQQQRWLQNDASLSTLTIQIEEAPPSSPGALRPSIPKQWRVVSTVLQALTVWVEILSNLLDDCVWLLMFGVPLCCVGALCFKLFRTLTNSLGGLKKEARTAAIVNSATVDEPWNKATPHEA